MELNDDQDEIVEAISEVWTDRVWLSGSLFELNVLDALDIDGVVTVMKENEGRPTIGSRDQIIVDVYDWEAEPLCDHFETAIRFMEGHKRVLVHCGAGASRSPSIVMAWMMSTLKLNLRQSFDHVKRIRSIVQPNEGFMEQLINFEIELFGVPSVSITDFDYGSD